MFIVYYLIIKKIKLKTNHEDLENLNELITDINNVLFNLLCDLINENNSNYLNLQIISLCSRLYINFYMI